MVADIVLKGLGTVLAGVALSVAGHADELKQGASQDRLNVTQLEEVLVTGSRLKQTAADGPTPVTVFDREKIDQLGASSVADVLQYLPQQPFGSPEGGSTLGVTQVRLRGLTAGTTLVLINGRRTTTSALTSGIGGYFDLGTIPLAAVERVEVLSGSASAVYGADAVGGVVNIILKRNIDRPTLDLHYGVATEGGAEERRASLAASYSGERLQVSGTIDAFDRDYLMGADRSQTANADYRRYGGSDRRSPYANPGNVCSADGQNLPGLPTACAAVPADSSGVGLTPADFLATAGATSLDSLGKYSSLLPHAKRLSATAFVNLDISENTSAFAELMYSDNDVTAVLSPPLLVQSLVPATNPFNPFGVPVRMNYLVKGLGSRDYVNESGLFRGVAGLTGKLGTWEWELSGLWLRDNGTSTKYHESDPTKLAAALAASDPALAFNPFQDGPGGGDDLLASLAQTVVILDNSARAAQGAGFIRGAIADLPAGSLDIVLGGEFRSESISFGTNPGSPPLVGDRDSWSTYAEMAVPLVSPAMSLPLVNQLAVKLAGRYDEYSDFGGVFNPQYGLEWRPIAPLLLRASYGTSFRPPTLYQLQQPRMEIPAVIADPKRGGGVTPFTDIFGGNPDLGPEKARFLSLGFVLTLDEASRTRIGATYWDIKQDHRVQAISYFALLANEDAFPSRVIRSAPTVEDMAAGQPGALVSIDSSNVNFGRLDVKGVDIEASSMLQTSWGRFTPSVLATWTDSYLSANLPSVPSVERVGVADVDGTIPRWRVTATLDWGGRYGNVGVSARHVSGYRDTSVFNPLLDRTVAPQTLVDLQVATSLEALLGYSSWVRGLRIRAGLQNVFNEQPHFSEVGGSAYNASLSDLRQRFFYLSLTKKF